MEEKTLTNMNRHKNIDHHSVVALRDAAKPTALRELQASLLDTSAQIAQRFGSTVRLTLIVEGLPEATIWTIADFVRDSGTKGEPIMIYIGRDILRIETTELPF